MFKEDIKKGISNKSRNVQTTCHVLRTHKLSGNLLNNDELAFQRPYLFGEDSNLYRWYLGIYQDHERIYLNNTTGPSNSEGQ